MAELDKLIKITVDSSQATVKIDELEVSLTQLTKAQQALSDTLIKSTQVLVRNEQAILKDIDTIKKQRASLAETTTQYGQFTAQIKQLESELSLLRGTSVVTADGIKSLKEMSEASAKASKDAAAATKLQQKELAEAASASALMQEKLNNTFIVANKQVLPQSINSLREQIRFTEQLKNSVDKTSFEYVQYTRTLERLNKELKSFEGTNAAVSSGFNQLRNNSGLASQTLVEVGRTVSDANYGFTAIANNLSQLSYYFVALVKDSNGVGAALKNLGRQLLGAGGIVIGLQLVITLIESYSLKQREAKQASESLTKSLAGVDGQVAVMESYASVLKDTNSSVDEQRLALKKLKDEGYDPLIGTLEQFLEAKKKILVLSK